MQNAHIIGGSDLARATQTGIPYKHNLYTSPHWPAGNITTHTIYVRINYNKN